MIIELIILMLTAMQQFLVRLLSYSLTFKRRGSTAVVLLVSSVIRQKGKSQKRVFQENKARQIFRKHFLPPVSVSVRSRGLEMFVFRKIGVLCFLETPVLRSPFLPYYRRFVNFQNTLNFHYHHHKILYIALHVPAQCQGIF